MYKLIALSIAVTACTHGGGHCEPQDGNQDGSRLMLEWLRYGDDAACISTGKVFDSQRQEWCVAADWDDGKQYCSPPVIGGIAFSDSACTQVLGGEGSGSYFGEYSQGELAHLWHSGTTAVTEYFVYYELDNNGACKQQGCVEGMPCHFTALGSEVSRSELEHMKTMPVGSDRFQPVHLESDDGMQVQVGTLAHDTMLDTDCAAHTFIEGAVCEPTDHGVTTLWSDSQCSQPVFYEEDASRTPPRTAYMDPIYCSMSVPRVYQVGAAIPSPAGAYYETSLDGVNEMCVQSTPTPQGGFYAISPVDMSVSRAPDKVSGRRLQIIHLAGDREWRDRVLYDTQLETECVASASSDGTSRCYPTALADAATVFSDPLCTTPIDVAFQPSPGEFGFGCALPPMPAYAKSDEGIRPVLGPGPQYVYYMQGTSCATVQMGPSYLVGAPLPDSAFATVHEISYP